ncbi:MAG: ribosomal-protein-alanine N-acetyltransferase [Cyclobacteriaceae bacterium]|jgi:ribosomal-protein-alanine N-acetyltransferase
MTIKYEKYSPADTVGLMEKESIIGFLFNHLEAYGDPKADITKCVDYALNSGNHPGGVIISAWAGEAVIGTVVINRTGMGGYIPENILVYIATHAGYRGQGIGKKLMEMALEETDGDIALHVEPENPARFLYEKLGFTNKYLEMRWKRPS